MRKRDSVEEDRMWGPIKDKEIFFKDYGEDGEVHISVDVYKYRVFVGQYDTTAPVWGVLGESFHSIQVELCRYDFEKAKKVKGEDAIISIIEKTFPGPNSVETFSAFCRKKGFGFSIHEDGPLEYDLIKKYEKRRHRTRKK